MREIQFRAWDKEENKMVSWRELIGYCDIDYLFGNINKERINIPDFEVMQYTGLKDKNGKEIYEGDIYKSSEGLIHQVVWHNNGFKSLYITHRIYQSEKYTEEVYGNLGDTESRRWGIEVIGNIYENQELLEVK